MVDRRPWHPPGTQLSAFAMAPNLKSLAIADTGLGVIHVLDTDPTSRTFHKVLGRIRVLAGPMELTWQPEGEALLAREPLLEQHATGQGQAGQQRRRAGGPGSVAHQNLHVNPSRTVWNRPTSESSYS